MKIIVVVATILACLALASCSSGTSSPRSIPPVHAAGPPILSGTYAFSLTVPAFPAEPPMMGVFTATPPANGTSGSISGELAAPSSNTFCFATFTGTFLSDANGLVTGTLNFLGSGSGVCYPTQTATFAASLRAPASPGGPATNALISVGPNLNGGGAASGEAVLQ